MYVRRNELDVRNLIVRIIINAAALFVADALIGGIRITGWQSYAVMAIVLGLVNAFAKPFLKAITCPLIVITLGLFLIVINTALLGLAAWISSQVGADVHIDGFWPAFFGAIIISIVGWALSFLIG